MMARLRMDSAVMKAGKMPQDGHSESEDFVFSGESRGPAQDRGSGYRLLDWGLTTPRSRSHHPDTTMSDAPKIHLTLPSGETRKYSLQMDSIRIGRAADNTVVLEDGSLSAHHAVLHRRETGFELVDLGSTNGIEVDGRRVLTHDLRDGDEVKIGSVMLRFEWAGQPDGPPPVAAPESVDPDVEPAPVAKVVQEDEPVDAPRETYRASAPSAEPKSGCLASLVLFTLTLLAPVIGMHVRHYQENGGKILLSEIIKHVQSAKKAETPPPTQP